jgi:titin
VQGNYIGTDVTGTRALGNGDGVLIGGGCSANIIGGTAGGTGNLISGNSTGVRLRDRARANAVQGNRIGTTADGTAALGNVLQGVLIMSGARENTIGGTVSGAGNLISGNGGGVALQDPGTVVNQVQGNLIGTDVSGSVALPGQDYGVLIFNGAAGNTVGVLARGPGRNVISGNRMGVALGGAGSTGNYVAANFVGTDTAGETAVGNRVGVLLFGGASANLVLGNVASGNASGIRLNGLGTTGNLVQGNWVGTDDAGTRALGNTEQGILVYGGASGNLVGGAGAGNIVSGNLGGIALQDSGTTGNLVQGNWVGPDVTGSVALPGQDYGVLIFNGAAGNTVGGATADWRTLNVISGNAGDGVDLGGAGTTANLVEGNSIGSFGETPEGNAGHGVALFDGASGNTIGGPGAGAGNTVAFNGVFGVAVDSGDRNTILGNAVFANLLGGIWLNAANHANDDLAAPVLTAASASGSVSGTASGPAGDYTVQFFGNPGPTNAQGEVLLGSLGVTLPGGSPFTFAFAPAPGLVAFTATLTDGLGNTSAFSDAVTPT